MKRLIAVLAAVGLVAGAMADDEIDFSEVTSDITIADGTGAFWLVLDEAEKVAPRTAFIYIASEDSVFTAECEVISFDDTEIVVVTEDGEVFTFNPAAGTIVPAD